MTVLHRRARTRPSRPFRSRRAPHNRPVPGLDKRPNCIRERVKERGFRTDGSEAAPPHLGARCRSQLGSYAPAAPAHSGKNTCDTCSHRRAVASLRRWQEQVVVRERHPNAPPPNRADAPGTASPPLLFPAVRGHRDRYKVPGPTGHNQPGLEQLCAVYF